MLAMLTLRLQRVGRKHDPSYRIVATNSRTGPKSNKHVDVLGHYDAIRKTTTITDADKIKMHIANGAQVTDTLHNILVTQGVVDGKKVNPLPQKSPVVDEEAIAAAKEAEEKAAAEAQAAKEAEETAAAEAEASEKAPAEEVTEEASAETEEEEVSEEPAAETEATEEAPVEEEKKEEE